MPTCNGILRGGLAARARSERLRPHRAGESEARCRRQFTLGWGPSASAKMTPDLAAEARYLHAALFARPADPAVIERFVEAHRLLFAHEPASRLVSTILARRLDAEAIEFALRRRRAGGELTRKLQILSYLAEVHAAYEHEFLNRRERRAGALLALAAAALRSAWKLVKGEILVRRHGLL